MKKSYPLLLISIFVITGCNSSDDGYLKEQLVGEWSDELYTTTDNETGEMKTYVAKYSFYNNSDYKRTTSVYKADGGFLGYILFVEGVFNVSDGDLRFNASKLYHTDEGTYVETIEELKSQNITVIEDGQNEEYRMEFTDDFNLLTLYFDCPENANCTAYPELSRIQ